MGAPIGNTNAAKARIFSDALRKAILQRDLAEKEDGKTLRQIANVLIEKALEGDLPTAMQVRDTLEGKPSQRLEVTGADDGPVQTLVKVVMVKAESNEE